MVRCTSLQKLIRADVCCIYLTSGKRDINADLSGRVILLDLRDVGDIYAKREHNLLYNLKNIYCSVILCSYVHCVFNG